MSFQKLKWALSLPLTSVAEKMVLVILADHCPENGYAYPSLSTLASESCLNRKTVIKCLKSLELQNFITDSGVRHGKTKSITAFLVGSSPKNGTADSDRGSSPTFSRKQSHFFPEAVPLFPGPIYMETEGTRRETEGSVSTVTEEPSKVPETDDKKDQPTTPKKQLVQKKKMEKKRAAPFVVFNNLWTAAFFERFGAKYQFSGSRDGKATRELLKGTGKTPEELMETAKLAWGKLGRDFWNCENKSQTIYNFQHYYNQIIVELANAKTVREIIPQRINRNVGTANDRPAGDYGKLGRTNCPSIIQRSAASGSGGGGQ